MPVKGSYGNTHIRGQDLIWNKIEVSAVYAFQVLIELFGLPSALGVYVPALQVIFVGELLADVAEFRICPGKLFKWFPGKGVQDTIRYGHDGIL